MEFTFTGDPTGIMDRVTDDTRLEGIVGQGELLRTVVNAQLKEFHQD
jgi:cell division control protein 6